MLFAIIKDNKVNEIKELDPESQEYNQIATTSQVVLDITSYNPQPSIGDIFDGRDIIVANPSMKITRLAMRQRFTLTELSNIHAAAKTNIVIEVLLDNIRVTSYIDLSRADTINGVNALVSYGLITSERAAEILNTLPTALERYIEGK